jgi:hypothetical protein
MANKPTPKQVKAAQDKSVKAMVVTNARVGKGFSPKKGTGKAWQKAVDVSAAAGMPTTGMKRQIAKRTNQSLKATGYKAK